MDSRQTRRALRAVLGDSKQELREDELSEEEGALPEEELDAMLADWEQRERSRVTELLAADLATAAIAGFIAAFKEWARRLRVDPEITPKPAPLENLRGWAREQASKLFGRVGKLMRKGAEAIVRHGQKEGVSVETILRRLRRFFRNPDATGERVQKTAEGAEWDAHHYGAYDANRVLGAEMKQWLTQPDDRVCPECKENAREGEIPLFRRFGSGHYLPPAHPNCRCELRFFSTNEERLRGVLKEYSLAGSPPSR